MKRFLFSGLAAGVLTASAIAAPTVSERTAVAPAVRSAAPAPASRSTPSGTYSGNRWGGYHHYPYYRHRYHHSDVFFGVGFGYPFYGYYDPFYYGYYPYGYSPYGYYPGRVVRGEMVAADNGSIVARVQQRLARAGYYHGAVDGVMGSGTRRAIRNYERSHGLPVDGEIDDQLLARLGLA